MFNVRGCEHRRPAAELPTDQFNGQGTMKDQTRGLRVDPHVVFGRGRDVAFATRSSAHYDAAATFCAMSGACARARAMLVSGPRVTTVRPGVVAGDLDDN